MTLSLNDLYNRLVDDDGRLLEDGCYRISYNNHFGSVKEYLFDTPGVYSGTLPSNHSARLADCIFQMIAGAKKHVDITNLGVPTGVLKDAILRGLVTAARGHGGPIVVRVLCGQPPGLDLNDTAGFVNEVRARLMHLGEGGRRIQLYVGAQELDMNSWNHSKYVAVDSTHLLTGGHNWNGEAYLGTNPIFDLSIRFDGPAANAAHRFSNMLWEFVRTHGRHGGGRRTYSSSLVDMQLAQLAAPRDADVPVVTDGAGDTAVLTVAQPGRGIWNNPADKSPSLAVMYWAIEHAQRIVRMSQQDLGGMGGFILNGPGEFGTRTTVGGVRVIQIGGGSLSDPNGYFYDVRLMSLLAASLARGVQLELVLSNRGAYSENGIYYFNGPRVDNVYRAFGYFLMSRHGMTNADACKTLRERLVFKTAGFAGKNRWTAGRQLLTGNHAKFWSVDDALFYVGSHNMYPSTALTTPGVGAMISGHLQEWGVVVGGAKETLEVVHSYFNPLLSAGCATAVESGFLPGRLAMVDAAAENAGQEEWREVDRAPTRHLTAEGWGGPEPREGGDSAV